MLMLYALGADAAKRAATNTDASVSNKPTANVRVLRVFEHDKARRR